MPFLDEFQGKMYDKHGEAEWMLLAPFRYCTRDGDTITVPTGAITDLASIPWLAQTIYKRDSPAIRAPSQPHDYLYRLNHCHKLSPDLFGSTPAWLTRKYADKVLYMACKENSACNNTRAWLFYRAVRGGGWLSWNFFNDSQKKDTSEYIKSLIAHNFDFKAYKRWAFQDMYYRRGTRKKDRRKNSRRINSDIEKDNDSK